MATCKTGDATGGQMSQGGHKPMAPHAHPSMQPPKATPKKGTSVPKKGK